MKLVNEDLNWLREHTNNLKKSLAKANEESTHLYGLLIEREKQVERMHREIELFNKVVMYAHELIMSPGGSNKFLADALIAYANHIGKEIKEYKIYYASLAEGLKHFLNNRKTEENISFFYSSIKGN